MTLETFDVDWGDYFNPDNESHLAAHQELLKKRWDAEFWFSHRVLRDLDRFARARMVSPWAVLGGCLLRVAASTVPDLVLPPIVGSRGSLNLIVASVGGSGTGKTAGTSVSRDFMSCAGEPESWPVGSGQGLAAAFLEGNGDRGAAFRMVRNNVHGVIYVADEVETLTQLGKVEGSTLLSVLRTAWSGGALGAMNADLTRRRRVEDHDYRLCLLIGVQPEMSGPLFAQDGAGTPQRFLWLPAFYDVGLVRPSSAEKTWANSWTPHQWAPATGYGIAGDQFVVCEQARYEIELDREARSLKEARGEDPGLDGHRLQARLKAAAALALLLEGTAIISEPIWELSEYLDQVSVKTREHARKGSVEASRKRGREAGIEAGARAETASAVASEEAEAYLRRRVLEQMSDGPKLMGDLTRSVSAKYRKSPAAGGGSPLGCTINDLVAEGALETLVGMNDAAVPKRVDWIGRPGSFVGEQWEAARLGWKKHLGSFGPSD